MFLVAGHSVPSTNTKPTSPVRSESGIRCTKPIATKNKDHGTMKSSRRAKGIKAAYNERDIENIGVFFKCFKPDISIYSCHLGFFVESYFHKLTQLIKTSSSDVLLSEFFFTQTNIVETSLQAGKASQNLYTTLSFAFSPCDTVRWIPSRLTLAGRNPGTIRHAWERDTPHSAGTTFVVMSREAAAAATLAI